MLTEATKQQINEIDALANSEALKLKREQVFVNRINRSLVALFGMLVVAGIVTVKDNAQSEKKEHAEILTQCRVAASQNKTAIDTALNEKYFAGEAGISYTMSQTFEATGSGQKYDCTVDDADNVTVRPHVSEVQFFFKPA